VIGLTALAAAANQAERREPLGDIARQYGLPDPVRSGSNVLIRNTFSTLNFEPGGRKLVFDGVLIWMNGVLAPNGRGWSLAECDAQSIIDPLLRQRQVLASKPVKIVVLDPGHGGEDTGAVGRRGLQEKKAVLNIARRVKAKLQSCDVLVYLTRPKDSTLDLPARAAAASRYAADVFLSIHLNSARNGDAGGIETYAIASEGFPSTSSTRTDYSNCAGNRHEAANTLLAYYVHRGVLSLTHASDRGVKHARFELLRTAPCPAALVECGFISNRGEERKLGDSDYRDSIAEGIARGILTYISKADGGS
jgi:N-acetylmuramoyl-L-alanine amidase